MPILGYGLVVDFDTNARPKDASCALFTVPDLNHIVVVEIPPASLEMYSPIRGKKEKSP